MTTDLAIRSTPTTHTRRVDLQIHHDAWNGPAGKVRAATAARDHDATTLVSAVWGYLYERSPQTSQHTIRSYAASVRQFVMWAETNGHPILRPGRNAGTAYRAHLADTMGPGSANTRLVGARALYHALSWVGLEHADPFQHVRAVRDTRPPETIRPEYSPTTVGMMFRAAQDPVDRIILLMAGACGLRAAELQNLTWESVDLAAAEARIVGKGRKPARVPLTPQTVDALQELDHRTGFVLLARTPDRNGNPRPICGSTIRYRVARMAAAAGVVPSHRGRRPRTQDGELVALGPHRLRHGYGTELAERYGVDAAQAGLRHASLATTGRYLKRRDVRVRAFAQEYRMG